MTKREMEQVKLAKLCEEIDRLLHHLEEVQAEQEQLCKEDAEFLGKKEEALRK